MSEETVEQLFEADPTLGDYISHHPSRRMMLLIRGAVIYSVAVLLLQIIFWSVDDQTASIFLPFIYAAISGGVFWYVLHLWNREVVLYEHGLSYQQGSNTAHVLYANIVRVRQRIEKVSLAGFFARTIYDYTLITVLDETLQITNLYSETEKLTRALDAYIARDRLPIIRQQIVSGQEAPFTEELRLTREGILYEARELFWHEYQGYRVQAGMMILQSKDNPEWAKISVIDINNPVLLITLLKERRDKIGEPPTP
jgi:uncharacterized membrane protein YiaA